MRGTLLCFGWVFFLGYISDNTVFALVFSSEPWAAPSEYAALARKELEWEGDPQSSILDADPVCGGIARTLITHVWNDPPPGRLNRRRCGHLLDILGTFPLVLNDVEHSSSGF